MDLLSNLRPHIQGHALRLRDRTISGTHTERLRHALEILACHAPTYDLLCDRNNRFTEHFTSLITQDSISENDELALLEDALIFIREKTLRTSRLKASFLENELLDWVEAGTMWHPNDGSLFSSLYYYDLPISIAKNIMRHVGSQQ